MTNENVATLKADAKKTVSDLAKDDAPDDGALL
jgi:hypothetical protein